ncbi:RDD family protein [Vibrio alginolyticus]|uniref:RDD family protein n=2 Tax=Vibrionaceae TaxID=641 RepID=UPI001E564F18|nr:RDD family protein [Vibrio alginolyticus]MCR9344916.1 RDD family protein [Vibrio alginolyticus]MCR9417127.1 RDD family protein [Vibrio alginolyticus]MCR9506630.1 RDD family protein [Vibrio alginolyticus]
MIDLFVSFSIFTLVLWGGLEIGIEKELVRAIAVTATVSYYLFSDCLPNGQSVGKKLLGIAVISARTGKKCNIFQSLFRNVITPFLGFIDSIFILGKKRQRLGDKLVRTVVVVH